MSDDEVDLELLELLRQSLGINKKPKDEITADTGVLKDAEYIYNNAVDVSIDMWGTKSAALKLWKTIQDRGYSTEAWSKVELHPKLGEEVDEVEMANFVFTMDLLNFSFWSALPEHDRFQVEFKDKRWTGYMSLVACLQRALSEGIPITTPRFWRSSLCSDDVIRNVFRSATAEQIPLLEDRIAILREAGQALQEFDDAKEADIPVEVMPSDEIEAVHAEDDKLDPGEDQMSVALMKHDADATDPTNLDHETALSRPQIDVSPETVLSDDGWVNVETTQGMQPATSQTESAKHVDLTGFSSKSDLSVKNLVLKADGSSGRLVNLLVKHFPSFRDECRFEGRKVRLLKRAQIFVADLYAACNNHGIGYFSDIGSLTMFADYRVPQILHRFGVLSYCPALETQIHRQLLLEPRSSWEVQIRGCSIWATELLRREISRQPGAESVNAVLIDFLLYDLAKELEFSEGKYEFGLASLFMHAQSRRRRHTSTQYLPLRPSQPLFHT